MGSRLPCIAILILYPSNIKIMIVICIMIPQASLGSASDVLTVSANNKATKLSKPLVNLINQNPNYNYRQVFIIPNNGSSTLACAFFDLDHLEWSKDGCSTVRIIL